MGVGQNAVRVSGDVSQPRNEPITVLVVDDQAIVREGLMTLLELADGVQPVVAAADGAEAVRLAAEREPQVVLMDLRMPGLDGVEATRQIRARQPRTEVVVLTTHADDASIIHALQAGARGYLTKDAGIAEITRAVQAAAAGQSVLDPLVQARLLAAASTAEAGLSGNESAAARSTATTGSTGRSPRVGPEPDPTHPASMSAKELPDELTPREAEVLSLIAAGLSNREIAERLVVSEATVKSHINHLFAKIGARDRAQAVHYAYTHGFAGAA